MFDDDDILILEGLSPEQKFCAIERLAGRKLTESRRDTFPNDPTEFDEFDYMVAVLAAAQEFDIKELSNWELPSRLAEDRMAHCQMFRDEARRVSHRLFYRHGIKNVGVALDAPTKQKISHWLKQIREVVQKSDVSAHKKDRLFALINKLQNEVDQERTPIRAAGELWVTICGYLGEGAKSLEPVAQIIERIGNALGIANEQQQPRLPAPPKKIEPPKKPKGGDDIPF